MYRIDIPQNYHYDGATIFRLLWRLIGHPLTPQFQLGAVFHDYICQNPNLVDNDRKLSSEILYYLLINRNVHKLLAKIMYFFVELYQIKRFGK